MDTTNALISLQAMAPHLSSTEISNIFNNECSQNFNQSVDYLLSMARNDSITEIKSQKKSKNNQTNVNTSEIYIDVNTLSMENKIVPKVIFLLVFTLILYL